MINTEEKQKIKDDVQQSFIERNRNTITEKISDCIQKGFTKDDANHTIIQAIQNLPRYLLPLETMPERKEVVDDKLSELVKHSLGLATHFPDED